VQSQDSADWLAFYLLFYVLLFIMYVFFIFHFLLQKKGEGDRSGEVTQIKELHKQELQGLLST